MARQVYYDPFGQRTTGYRAGIEDEISLQDQTRRARASDYDYNQIAPIRLETMQREQALGQFADPYLRNAYGLQQRANEAGLAGAELGIRAQTGQATGDYAPYLTTAINYNSGNSVGSEQMYPGQVRAYNEILQNQMPQIQQIEQQLGLPAGALQQWIAQQTGTISPAVENGIDQFFGYDRAMQLAQANSAQNALDFTQQLQGQNTAIDAQNANTQQMNILGMLQRWRQQGGATNGASVDEDGF